MQTFNVNTDGADKKSIEKGLQRLTSSKHWATTLLWITIDPYTLLEGLNDDDKSQCVVRVTQDVF